ncbi:porin family protein [Limibacter armeniacum]|uniref:porin family protein n=1 Tax=Limibacter armeniacum TaxID=466084 RepID=UPI002FE5CBB0
MKKLLLTTFVCLMAFFVSEGYAQLVIKPLAGINTTSLRDLDGNDSNIGYQFGGNVMFGHHLYIEPGVQWFRREGEFRDNGTDYKTKFKGIRVPLNFGLSLFEPDAALNVRGFVGGSASFITDSNGTQNQFDFDDVSWGVGVGAGVDFLMFFLDLNYEWGINDIIKEDIKAKPNAFYANFGVRIPL